MTAATPKTLLLLLIVGAFWGFMLGVVFQRQMGIGHFLKRLGLRQNSLLQHELSPRFQTLRNMAVPRDSIVFVGDSLVDLQEWNEVFPDMNVINRGVSGATIPDLTGAFEYDGARAVFCLIGINDIGRETSTEEFAKRYERLVNSVDRNYNFHTIAIPFFFSYGGKPIDRHSIHGFNEIIRDLSRSRGFTFIDTGASQDWERGDFERDGLHLSQSGYRKLADFLKPYLEKTQHKPSR